MLCFRGLSVARGARCARRAPLEKLAKAQHCAARVEAPFGAAWPAHVHAALTMRGPHRSCQNSGLSARAFVVAF